MKHLITTLALSIASLTYGQDQWEFSKMVNYKLEVGTTDTYYATDTMECNCKLILTEGDYGRMFLSVMYAAEVGSRYLVMDYHKTTKSHTMTIKNISSSKEQGITILLNGKKAELFSVNMKSKTVFIL
jgi:hypothetical protein